MSKPCYRWATRDRTSLAERNLWRRKPVEVSISMLMFSRPGFWCWPGPKPADEGDYIKVSQAYCRKRFGRDLRPGERRPLK